MSRSKLIECVSNLAVSQSPGQGKRAKYTFFKFTSVLEGNTYKGKLKTRNNNSLTKLQHYACVKQIPEEMENIPISQ